MTIKWIRAGTLAGILALAALAAIGILRLMGGGL
jgi:hypothetical protein